MKTKIGAFGFRAIDRAFDFAQSVGQTQQFAESLAHSLAGACYAFRDLKPSAEALVVPHRFRFVHVSHARTFFYAVRPRRHGIRSASEHLPCW